MLCSIIIPAFNGAEYLSKTIDSCLSQFNMDKLEIIVVDDCSQDDSYDIAFGYVSGNDNFKVFRNDCNLGFCKSANRGVEVARGDFLMILGQDDLLSPSHVESMLRKCKQETVLVHCNSQIIDSNGIAYGKAKFDWLAIFQNYFYGLFSCYFNVVHSTGALIRRDAFVAVGGFDSKYANYGEWVLWNRLYRLGRIDYVRGVESFYRRHKNNISNTFSGKNLLLQIYIEDAKSLARSNAKVLTRCFLPFFDVAFKLRSILFGN